MCQKVIIFKIRPMTHPFFTLINNIMNTNIKYILLFILIVSCSTKNDQLNDQKDIPVILFNKFSYPFKAEDIECKFIPLETTTENLIGEISQIEILDNRIFILDWFKTKAIYVFDITGEFITRIGARGTGPGEYINPMSFFLNKQENTLSIVDLENKKILIYDSKTYNYIKSKRMPSHNNCIQLSNGSYAFFSPTAFADDKRNFCHLKIADSTMKQVKDYYPAEFISPYAYLCGSNFHKIDNNIFVHTNYSPIIWQILPNGIKSAYKIEVENSTFPPLNWLREEASDTKNYLPALNASNYIMGYALQETSDYLNMIYEASNKVYNCFYNKKTKNTSVYSFTDFWRYAEIEGQMSQAIGVYNDYFICYLSPEALKSRPITRQNLRQITEKLSEDSNPVLCLYKFK